MPGQAKDGGSKTDRVLAAGPHTSGKKGSYKVSIEHTSKTGNHKQGFLPKGSLSYRTARANTLSKSAAKRSNRSKQRTLTCFCFEPA